MQHGMVEYPRFLSSFRLWPAQTKDAIAERVLVMVRLAHFSRGQAVMGRTVGHSIFLLLLASCVVQFVGTACFDDCHRQWSTNPVHAQDQLPGSLDGQTESDQGEGELDELAPAQGEPFGVIRHAGTCMLDHASCPRTQFASDWFRPPARS